MEGRYFKRVPRESQGEILFNKSGHPICSQKLLLPTNSSATKVNTQQQLKEVEETVKNVQANDSSHTSAIDINEVHFPPKEQVVEKLEKLSAKTIARKGDNDKDPNKNPLKANQRQDQ